jgi:putative transposase
MSNYRRVNIQGGTYFFTIVTNQRKHLFLNDIAIDLFLEALFHVKNYHPFFNLAYCILPDHIHFLWEMPFNDANYSIQIGEIKKRFSKHYIAEYGMPNIISQSQRNRGETGIWQRRFWEHYIRDEDDLKRHINYIHYNPVNHGLVDRVNEWSASSFFDYVDQGYYDFDWGQGELRKFDSHLFGE